MDETGKQLEKKKWTEMHDVFEDVCRKMGVKKVGQIIASGQGGVAKDGEATFSPAKKCPEAAFNRSWALRKSVFGSLERGHTPSIAFL